MAGARDATEVHGRQAASRRPRAPRAWLGSPISPVSLARPLCRDPPAPLREVALLFRREAPAFQVSSLRQAPVRASWHGRMASPRIYRVQS